MASVAETWWFCANHSICTVHRSSYGLFYAPLIHVYFIFFSTAYTRPIMIWNLFRSCYRGFSFTFIYFSVLAHHRSIWYIRRLETSEWRTVGLCCFSIKCVVNRFCVTIWQVILTYNNNSNALKHQRPHYG